MKAQHALSRPPQGDWYVAEEHLSPKGMDAYIKINSFDDDGVAYVFGRNNRAERAHLIAAAPELLEALCAVLRSPLSRGGHFAISEETEEVARAAIAKAEGSDQ